VPESQAAISFVFMRWGRLITWFIVVLVVLLAIWFIPWTEIKSVGTKLPDANTLIAVLSVLALPITTLVVLAVTQWNNRKTKEIELNHQSELKDIELKAQERLKVVELQEENRRIARAEKRSIYKDILRESRHIVHYWADAGRDYWHSAPGPLDKPLDPDGVIENAKRLRHYHELKEKQAEADSLASEVVVELIGAFADLVRNCEQRVLFEAQNQGITDPKAQDALWRGVQSALQQEFRDQGVQAAYFALRGQIRKELGAI